MDKPCGAPFYVWKIAVSTPCDIMVRCIIEKLDFNIGEVNLFFRKLAMGKVIVHQPQGEGALLLDFLPDGEVQIGRAHV